MRQALLIAAGALTLTSAVARAEPVCTLIADAESDRVMMRDGPECALPTSPASTFKLALALMGFDAGILVDVHQPAWPYRSEYRAMAHQRKTTDPLIWMKDSPVWYSQKLTRELGEIRFRRYVDGFSYGDRNIAGDPGKNNGLTHAWLSSSLKISPDGQILFLRKLWNRQLQLSADAYAKTLAVTPAFTADDGWTIYGKTGTGFQRKANGALDRDRQFGWFIGWAVKGGRAVLFARLVKDEKRIPGPAGPRARDAFLGDFPKLIATSS